YKNALNSLNKAQKINPNISEIYFTKSNVFLKISQHKNAMDALVEKQPRLRRIKIRVGQTENHQILEVQDNAGGIDEEIIDRIFDPYFTTKGTLNGTGLGLYMSKLIIEEHLRGKLLVQNQDSGANFRIELPY
ncbi:MAG: ATP-binding protein, partial [SAR324 cluster bacterium]|nr:ATP-binding protein [SAR324 cluster bacterium]